jgi:DNA repair photolyase
MGFPDKISRYPLTPLELLYSIINNPYFFPGAYGTLVAIGSVTEPLHSKVFSYTVEFLGLLNRYLGNPVQVSTKVPLGRDGVESLYASSPSLSVLVSIVTLRYSRVVEPNAPDIGSRVLALQDFVGVGLHTSVFIRPILPGITDREFIEILDAVSDMGVRNIVIGSLRVNRDIMNRLSGVDLVYKEILDKVDWRGLGSRQVNINLGGLKKSLENIAREVGFHVFPSACSANLDAMGQSCFMCRNGPCGEFRSLPYIDDGEIHELLDMYGIRAVDIDVGDWISVRLSSSDRGKVYGLGFNLKALLSNVYRRIVKIEYL